LDGLKHDGASPVVVVAHAVARYATPRRATSKRAGGGETTLFVKPGRPPGGAQSAPQNRRENNMLESLIKVKPQAFSGAASRRILHAKQLPANPGAGHAPQNRKVKKP
jgi:hypothetical protein